VNEGGPPRPCGSPNLAERRIGLRCLPAATRPAPGWGLQHRRRDVASPDVLGLPAIPDLQLGLSPGFPLGGSLRAGDGTPPAGAARGRRAVRGGERSGSGIPDKRGRLVGNGARFLLLPEKDLAEITRSGKMITLIRRHYGRRLGELHASFVPPSGLAFVRPISSIGVVPPRSLRPGGRGHPRRPPVDRADRRGAVTTASSTTRARAAIPPRSSSATDCRSTTIRAVRAMVPTSTSSRRTYNVDSPDGWVSRATTRRAPALRRKPSSCPNGIRPRTRTGAATDNNCHPHGGGEQAEPRAVCRGRGGVVRAGGLPTIGGAHWFQLYDNPRGRTRDGRGLQLRLVESTTRRTRPLVDAFAAVNRASPALHRPLARARDAASLIPRARIERATRSLVDWPKARALVPGIVAEQPGEVRSRL